MEEIDWVYEMMVDGHPKVRQEIVSRACINYPYVCELTLITIHRYQQNSKNLYNDVFLWLKNSLEILASKYENLGLELEKACESGKSIDEIIN